MRTKWIRRGAAAVLPAALTLTLFGCVPSGAPPMDASSGVHADWSALEPYTAPQNQYTRRSEEFMDTLCPADDYGNLIPFPGRAVSSDWMGDVWLYGLVTARGEIVVDPVYSDAYQLSWYDYENSCVVYEPYLYLTKVHYDAQAGREEKDITVAALDGSWCRSGYSKVFGVSEGLLVACTADAQVEAIDGATGKLIWSKRAEELHLPFDASDYGQNVDFSCGMLSYVDVEAQVNYFLDVASQHLACVPCGEMSWPVFFTHSRGKAGEMQMNGSVYYGIIDRTGVWVTPPQFVQIDTFRDGRALATLRTGARAVIDTDGNVLHSWPEGEVLVSCGADGDVCYLNVREAEDYVMGEYRSYPQYEVISACDGAFELLNAPMPGEKLVWRYDDTYCIFSDRQVAVGRGTRQTVVPIPEGMFFSHSSTIGEDRLVLEFDNETTGEYACGLYGLSGDTLIAPGTYRSMAADYDGWSGEICIIGWRIGEEGYDVLDSAGQMRWSLPVGASYPRWYGGCLLVQDAFGTMLLDTDGDLLFRYLTLDGDI